MIHEMRLWMEKNKYLEKLVEPIRRTKIMTYRRYNITGLKGAKAIQSKFQADYEMHKEEFEKLAQMLEDDFSRKTLQAVIDYRLDPRGGGY